MEVCYYSEKHNTVYIKTECIMPKVTSANFTEHCKIIGEVFKMSYPDRIEKYASESEKDVIRKMLLDHPGCKISEFTTP